MRKFGTLLDCLHQQCFAHALHLGVCDVLYKKQIQDLENDEGDSTDEEEEGGGGMTLTTVFRKRLLQMFLLSPTH
ncbi:Uncharacterized protein FKW44_015939 [Caligus rogercresseyi]|uniref:Uncharacterized protein n=1 Tax=Caligus rogercresseyi TaxID=217165 RepID=A0A7T8H146_CALRO|nr:Uncharacterized protein FKW44_015939 [Caligus rogercresseyi]